MATTRKVLREEVKTQYLETLMDFFDNQEQVLRTGSNEIAFPVVDREGNEDFVVLTVKIPTGERDGTPYDGYAAAEDYRMKCEAKAEKAKAKAEKAAADKAKREKAKAEKSVKTE